MKKVGDEIKGEANPIGDKNEEIESLNARFLEKDTTVAAPYVGFLCVDSGKAAACCRIERIW